ncbi:putative short-chain dehydrogenase/reductase family protein [Xylariales sp. AK1849]|nr:putative short-chain dehydrogenase/reductase family protein [Xylariales sp. AK1849]
MGLFLRLLHSQLFVTLPIPTKRYNGQTVVVTGANVGLGLEAARHFVRLDAKKVILAVRNKSKGEAAATSIEQSTGRTGVVEVWDLDLCSYASVKSCASRASCLDRLDIVVNNAGIVMYDFELAEGNECTITVNVVSAMLLGLLLLPKLRETSARLSKETVLTFTGSFVHFMTEFSEQKSENILKDLAVREKASGMENRYYVSKLIQLLLARELADRITNSSKPGDITVSVVNPGFVKTEVMRNASAIFQFFFVPWRAVVARPTETGARTLLHGAEGGRETHGQYLDNCRVSVPSDFVTSIEGRQVQRKLWRELIETLESVSPGIMENI